MSRLEELLQGAKKVALSGHIRPDGDCVGSVMSVYQYMKVTKTNYFGAVLDQELRYCFTYIGDDGQLHEFDDYEHTEYGLWKICIGDENKYVVRDGFDTYRWLYLTEETFNNMPSK